METPKKTPQERRVLRPTDSPCVWMTAGLVAYKLCDRNFECDACPFDTAMLGGERRLAASQEAPAEPAAVEYPVDRVYSPAHAWAGVLDERRLRIGLDSFAAQLLRHMTGVILPPPGSTLSQDRVGCWITDEAETLSLPSPVSGTVLRVNHRLRAQPALVAGEPYGDGWLAEIGCEDAETALAGLLPAAEMKRRARADLQRLRDASIEAIGTEVAAVGPTLPDGGEPLGDLIRIVGAKRYYLLVAGLLG